MDKGFVTALSTAFRMRDMEEVDRMLLDAPVETNSESEIEVAVSDAARANVEGCRICKIAALRSLTNAAAKTIICALCFFVITITSVEATTHCLPPKRMESLLLKQYRELPIGTRKGEFLSKVVLYASKAGTWTIVRVADGKSCIIGAGKDWEVPAMSMFKADHA